MPRLLLTLERRKRQMSPGQQNPRRAQLVSFRKAAPTRIVPPPLLLALLLAAGALSGCGSTNSLPEQPTAEQIADAAVRWIEAAGTTAQGERGPEWFYQKGGREARGRGGAMFIKDDTYYFNLRGNLQDAATWVKVSPADFSAENAEDRVRAEPVSYAAVAILPSNPLLALKQAAFETEVTESEDGTAWIVQGTAARKDIYRQFLGDEGARALAEYVALPDIGVELSVSKEDGRPVSTTLERGGGLEPWTCWWTRTIWKPADDAVLTLDEYMETAEPMEPSVTTTVSETPSSTTDLTVTTLAADRYPLTATTPGEAAAAIIAELGALGRSEVPVYLPPRFPEGYAVAVHGAQPPGAKGDANPQAWLMASTTGTRSAGYGLTLTNGTDLLTLVANPAGDLGDVTWETRTVRPSDASAAKELLMVRYDDVIYVRVPVDENMTLLVYGRPELEDALLETAALCERWNE